MHLSSSKIIVFDMDGVIVDSINLMWELSHARFPKASYAEFQQLFTGNLLEELELLNKRYEGSSLSEEEDRILRHDYTSKKTSSAELYPGIKELLENLVRQGIHLAINTSASRENTMPLLGRLGVLDSFDLIITRDEEPSKVEKFRNIADHFGVIPGELLFITDSVGDVRDAHELSIPTVAVTWGIHNREHFQAHDFSNLLGIIDNVSELESMW